MTSPPPPAPMTSDEHEPEEPTLLSRVASLAARALSAVLAAWATVRRLAMGMLAVAIMLAVAGLAGFAVGRHSVTPRPGEEARLDTFDKRAQAVADSARKVAEWEAAQRAILEQRAAALPRVTIREPGVLVIGPTDQQLAPRVVPVPVEVTQALATERAITASLRVELAAVKVEAAAERARADSLSRAVVLARSERRGFLSDRVVIYGGHSLIGREWQVGVGVALWRWP